MAKKSGDGKADGSANRPGLKVVAKPDGSAVVPDPSSTAIFDEKRSGRDRREQDNQVEESRRMARERRKRSLKQAAWWLERDYVESHHFVQKSSSSRSRKQTEDNDED